MNNQTRAANDLAQRLREATCPDCGYAAFIFEEAAGEIERLRVELAAAEADISTLYQMNTDLTNDLMRGFMRALQNENQCSAGVTGSPCGAETCGCYEELKAWCEDE